MVNKIKTIYLCGLNKSLILKFPVGSWVWKEKPEKAKECIHQNIMSTTIKMNCLNDKNCQTSSQKFRLDSLHLTLCLEKI